MHDAPEYAWSFEPHHDFSFELENLSSQELADPAAIGSINYTADVYRDGKQIRRVGVAPLPEVVPVGEKRVFETELGISVVGGDYEMSFGIERDNGGEPLRFGSPRYPLRVKNTNLVVGQMDVAEFRVDVQYSVAERVIERVNWSVSFADSDNALAVDHYSQRRLGIELSVLAPLN